MTYMNNWRRKKRVTQNTGDVSGTGSSLRLSAFGLSWTGQSKRKPSLKRSRRPRPRNRGNRSIHLWEFLKETLNNSEKNKSYIKWISKREGIFQLVNSSGVVKLWGQRKNRKKHDLIRKDESCTKVLLRGYLGTCSKCSPHLQVQW
ncbi:DNA-binding D-ETS-4-like isoform X3 [Paramuricea clavata]|uniref:DNA-binding D-ETS-4-like isoform X3 n=1 Tax=Paramuricea clavata TaxID=317549 RepID=A0A6S7FPZ8_PARCT|nr:DNA-binding D-ETS-4-like isoform X3 [Paramuricea clavata]